MRKNVKIAAGIALVVGMSGAANAAIYDIRAVLNSSDRGFGFSGFHFAGVSTDTTAPTEDTDANAASGTIIAGIDGTPVSGTYNDVSGDLDMVLTLSGVGSGTATLSGTGFIFDGGGVLSSAASLDVVFTSAVSSTVYSLYDTTIDFSGSVVCCAGATPPPNSFDGLTMSLWGADFPNPNLGLDLRIELYETTPTTSTVPVPAAVWLFGSGLLGLIGVARRRA